MTKFMVRKPINDKQKTTDKECLGWRGITVFLSWSFGWSSFVTVIVFLFAYALWQQPLAAVAAGSKAVYLISGSMSFFPLFFSLSIALGLIFLIPMGPKMGPVALMLAISLGLLIWYPSVGKYGFEATTLLWEETRQMIAASRCFFDVRGRVLELSL